MTKELVGAYTKIAGLHPGYVNVSRNGETVILTVRGDPKVKEDSAFICTNAKDAGPGRCFAGDENCNNYCNMAPEKGPMQDRPKATRQVWPGETVSVSFTAEEWAAVISTIGAKPA